MDIPKNFTFFGQQKTLPQGQYDGMIIDFSFKEKTSKAGNPYITLSAKVEIQGQNYFVNLSLDPAEKGKATHSLILQLIKQTGKTEKELIDLCATPADFFNLAKGKPVRLVSTEKGYIDIWSEEKEQAVDPKDIPFEI